MEEKYNNQPWEIIQECAMVTGDYDKRLFEKLVERLGTEEFNRFCRGIMLLTEYYDTSCGAYATDHKPLLEKLLVEHPNMFWKLERIDFDRPINFKIVE